MNSGKAAVPFRWDLVTPDQLGSLLEGIEPPDVPWRDEFVTCAGKVVARSGGGQLVFVGRSLDSMFDLLSGAFTEISQPKVARFPVSFSRTGAFRNNGRWSRAALTPSERQQAREILATAGAHPNDLARRQRPLTFVDVVHAGGTFTDVFNVVRDWVEDERAPWAVIRKKVRFIGVTSREKTSPNTWRWQQHAPWTEQLPSSAVVNVSLDPHAWSYFGDHQTKLHRTFRPKDWTADVDSPTRDEKTRLALAEAVSIVRYGRSRDGRQALARVMSGEGALAEPWLRTLITHLNRSGAP